MKERLYGLELLRFIAAALVLFFHISVIGVGEFGVDIFFIISGFVMMYSTQTDSRNFFLKRLIRIVPLYWLVTIITFSFYYIFPSFFSLPSNDLSHLVMSLLFIPFDKNGSGHAPILSVGWTLNYEMYFYFLFSLACIISNKNRGIVVVFLIVVIMFVLYFFDNFNRFFLKLYFDRICFHLIIMIFPLIFDFIFLLKELKSIHHLNL
jgi:peptidoglycan/LPS O-acetylase OafA/YrhL